MYVGGLHSSTHTPPIVHRDLTHVKILFAVNDVIKIGDLGQSRLRLQSCTQPVALSFMPLQALLMVTVLKIFSLGRNRCVLLMPSIVKHAHR